MSSNARSVVCGVLTSVAAALGFGKGCMPPPHAGIQTLAVSSSAESTTTRPSAPSSAASVSLAGRPPIPFDASATWVRVRVTSLEPVAPTKIRWRRGGEGLGGAVYSGEFYTDGGEVTFQKGQWSTPTLLQTIVGALDAEDAFFTITAGEPGRFDRTISARTGYSRNVVFEVEERRNGVTKTLQAVGPNGGTATLGVPGRALKGFAQGLTTVDEVARSRLRVLRSLPWAPEPRPQLYAITTDLGGYGLGSGYGIRVTDPKTVETEMESLLELGVNSLRTAPEFVLARGNRGERLRAQIVGPVGYPVPASRKERANAEAGCPFGTHVPELQQKQLERALRLASSARADEVWVLTNDEIGAVTDLADEDRAHLVECARCADGFRDWLRQRKYLPRDLGAETWADVRPLAIWKPKLQPWLGDQGLSRRAYLTSVFLNHASAQLFSPLRDALNLANERKRSASGGSETPWMYSYALRRNTFLMGASALDFFEFYRLADNAIVYETSNRDSRVWQWDSYLMDVQRVLMRELGLKGGVYVKPHRGAPVQRALSAVSRGNSLLYWYTFGPDYWKGDAFSSNREALASTSKAAWLLSRAEAFLYGSTQAVPPRVAVVRAETTQRWLMRLADNADIPMMAAASENGKWIYTALQHSHVLADPLDETFLTELDLSKYAAVYVSGSHVTAPAASALERYVRAGGLLYTSGWGLARDESNFPLPQMNAFLGVASRIPEHWCQVKLYGAGQLADLSHCSERGAVVFGSQQTRMPLRIGREIIVPAPGAEILARFEDGHPAILRNRVGKGEVILVGFFPGLEYAAPVAKLGFDMRRDFQAARREVVSNFALDRLGPLPLEVSDPFTEGVLLRSSRGRRWAVTLVNWAYRDATNEAELSGLVENVALQPSGPIRLILRGLGPVRRVRSTALNLELPIESVHPLVTALPALEDGDVLTVE